MESSTTEFRISQDALGNNRFVTTTEERFKLLKQSARILRESLAIEQKYGILLRNYLDFEKELLERLANALVSGLPDYFELYENLLAYDVRLVNFLSVANLYADQAPLHAGRCEGKIGRDRAKKLFSEEYDANPSYRFMCALRNHVIHGDLPVHAARIGGAWIEQNGERHLEHTVAIRSERATLADFRAFKKTVLKEMPDTVDLATAVRSFMVSLNAAHLGVRDIIKDAVTESRGAISSAIDDFFKSTGAGRETKAQPSAGIRAQKIAGTKTIESVALLLQWDDVRLKLIEKNGRLSNLHRRFVTGRSRAQ